MVIYEDRAGYFAFLSSWCLMIIVWFFLAVPWGCLQFVIVVFPDHTHLGNGHYLKAGGVEGIFTNLANLF